MRLSLAQKTWILVVMGFVLGSAPAGAAAARAPAAADPATIFAAESQRISQQGWHKVSASGIDNPLFQAFSQVDEKSSLVAMRFVAVIDYPIEEAASVWFANHERKPEWMDLCEQFVVLEKVSDYEFVHQVITKAVFPAAARTFVSKATVHIDREKRLIKGYSLATPYPKLKQDSDLVLGAVKYSHTFMSEPAPGKTLIDLSVLADPGGWIPTFLVNFVAKSWPAKSYQGLLGQLRKGNFQTVAIFQ